MKLFTCPARVTISLMMGGVIAVFATFPDTFFPPLSLERSKLADGEIWRLFTSNFVHFGWAHTFMNLSAFAIFAFALAASFSTTRFIALILFCCTTVGLGVYYLNPEYETYAGLSGAIHGFFVAGLLLNKRHPFWVNGLLVAALFGKIIAEHQPGYQASELQSLLPVAVAYDAHLYGAIAGAIFGLVGLFIDKYLRKQNN